jgi:hypothetical protein
MSHARKYFVVSLPALCIVAFLAGCASKPQVLPAQSHAPLPPDQVKIYESVPSKYEDLGMLRLEMTAQYRWDELGDATAAIDEMKNQAAAKGANGLLLRNGAESNVYANARYNGTYLQVPVRTGKPPAIFAQAIYVPAK